MTNVTYTMKQLKLKPLQIVLRQYLAKKYIFGENFAFICHFGGIFNDSHPLDFFFIF